MFNLYKVEKKMKNIYWISIVMLLYSTERNNVIGSGNNLNILYVVNEIASIPVAARS